MPGVAEVNGTRLAYDITGAGPDMVLVSGGGTLDRRLWNSQVAAFARQHRVIRYDIRGIGQSARPDAPFSHAEDLAELLAKLNAASVDVVGLSFGSAIAVDLALDHPALVRRLVLASPGLSSDRKANLQGALTLSALARSRGVPAAIDQLVTSPTLMPGASNATVRLVRTIYAENADVFTNDFPLVRFWVPSSPPAVDRLASIRVPTLILAGERDSPSIHDTASTLHDRIGGSSIELLPGAGHLLNLHASGEFDRVVSNFLRP